MFDPFDIRLGRKAVKTDSRTLRLRTYLPGAGPALPAPPLTIDYAKPVKTWGMHLNDKLGCCTIAGLANAIQTWTANTTTEAIISDALVLNYYEKWDGYNPKKPKTDAGGIELDVLNNCQKQTFGGHKLLAFASVNMKNLVEVRTAIALFGGVYIGVALPLSAQGQKVWDVSSDPKLSVPGSWGGHCVWMPKYDQDSFTAITWDEEVPVSNDFATTYIDEGYALLSPDWIAKTVLPGRFALDVLQADLALIQ